MSTSLSQDLGHWVECHVAAFEYCLGTPRLVVPDYPRTGVDRACRYEPDLNRTYHEMALHYGVAVMPARPRKPRDKGLNTAPREVFCDELTGSG